MFERILLCFLLGFESVAIALTRLIVAVSGIMQLGFSPSISLCLRELSIFGSLAMLEYSFSPFVFSHWVFLLGVLTRLYISLLNAQNNFGDG